MASVRLARLSGLGPWLIAMLVVLAYWPLSTFQLTLSEADAMNCWLPWRFFISAALQDGNLPLWNPYQQMGYPVHADLQGPFWYPEALALGGTLGHGPHLLSILFLAYVAIGGVGMRTLVLRCQGTPLAATMAGVAYALSGFFTGHAMHFYSVISAAWLPWLFAALLHLLDRPSPRKALVVAVFLFLLLSGGNHTFLLIGAYPLCALGLHALYRAWRRDGPRSSANLAGTAVLAIAVACVLAVGTLHAVWEVGPYLARSSGLPLEKAAVEAFTPRAALSLILPWTAADDAITLGTDPPMGNGYFGALMLAFALVGMMRPIRGHERILLITAAISAMAAMGPALPVHALLWKFVPGMDLFRFPAYFRLFTLLCILPTAAAGFTIVVEQGQRHRTFTVLLALMAAGILAVGIGADREGLPSGPTLRACMLEFPGGTRVMLNAAFSLVLLALAWYGLRHRSRIPWLCALVIAEMLVAIQFTQWRTTLGLTSPAQIQWRIDTQAQGPLVPEASPLGESFDSHAVMHPLWCNTQVFRGMPTHDGFNSFWLSSHEALRRDYPDLLANMKAMPLVYHAAHVRPSIDDPAGTAQDSALLVPAEPEVVSMAAPSSAGDRVTITDFRHGLIGMRSETVDSGFLVVQQNYYPGWRIRIDGEPAPVHRVNVAAFGTVVPPGEHQVEVRYERPGLAWLLALSLIGFIAILFGLSFTATQGPWLRVLCTSALAAALTFSLFGHRPKAERTARTWAEVRNEIDAHGPLPVLLHTDRPDTCTTDAWRGFRLRRPDDTQSLDAALRGKVPDSLWLAWAGPPLGASMKAWALDHHGPPLARLGDIDAGAWLLGGASPRELGQLFHHDLPGEGAKLHAPDLEFSQALRIPVSGMLTTDAEHLVVDFRYRAGAGCQGRLVMERKRHGHLLDHETLPITCGNDSLWRSMYVTRPVRLLGDARDTVVVYLWNAGAEDMHVRDLRVRVMDLPE